MSTLKEKTFSGLKWSFIDNVSGSGITFIVGLILARILDPSTFGIVGMVTIFIAVSAVFVESGFSSGLIRKKECTNKEYCTVFYFNITVSLFFYTLLYCFAPLIANFYSEPRLILILRILGLIVIIDSLSIVQKTKFIRAIDFRRQAKISITASVTSGISAVYLALNGFGVWSLIAQIIIRQSIITTLFWIFSSWRPILFFSKSSFKELFTFGSRLLITSLLNTLQNNLYYVIIGHYFSAKSLGFYTRAEQFNAIVINNITGPMERVILPVLTPSQDEKEILINNFKKSMLSSFFITFLGLSFLMAAAKPLIIILIGVKWETSILYLQLFCLGSIFYPLITINQKIMILKGRSNLLLRLQFIRMCLLIPVLASGIIWGIKILLVLRIITSIIDATLNMYMSGMLLSYPLIKQIKDIFPYFVNIGIIAIILFCVNLFPLNYFLMLLVQLCSGIILFIILFESKHYPEYIEIKEYLKNKLNNTISFK